MDPFVDCLRSNGITNYWYDKERIKGGDLLIKEINDGLSTSKIGVIILSKNYLEKNWTMWEYIPFLSSYLLTR